MGIQRKKQYPGLAYRTSEVIGTSSVRPSQDTVDFRTRSEERNDFVSSKSGPRSRSAEPSVGRHEKKAMVQSYPPLTSSRGTLVSKIEEFPEKVIRNKNTEYQSQFAWPQNTRGEICTARKSISMGLIKAPDHTDSAVQEKVEKKNIAHRSTHKEFEMPSIAERPVKSEKNTKEAKKKQTKTEYKAKYKPFTSYVYIDGQWKKTSRLIKICQTQGAKLESYPWYSEVMERLQKANAYKCRGHGHPVYGEQLPNIYMQQNETTPLVRPKKDLPELHIPNIPIDTKKLESRKREHQEKKSDKKPEETIERKQEKKKSSRPKSAEPTKSRTSRATSVHPRPQTAPPPSREKSAPAQRTYTKKVATKSPSSEVRKKHTSKLSKKTKEELRPMLPPDGRASRTSHHPPPPSQSCSGKVWLQAGGSQHSSEMENFKEKPVEPAVRPSTLLPPPKSPPKEEPVAITEVLKEEETKIIPSSTPVPLTHVQTPEEVTGVKSPEPENWTVPIDKGQKLQWTESSATDSPLKVSSPKIENLEKNNESKEFKPDMAFENKISNPILTQEPYSSTSASSATRMTTADVLDRARSRLDQFWGKNK